MSDLVAEARNLIHDYSLIGLKRMLVQMADALEEAEARAATAEQRLAETNEICRDAIQKMEAAEAKVRTIREALENLLSILPPPLPGTVEEDVQKAARAVLGED